MKKALLFLTFSILLLLKLQAQPEIVASGFNNISGIEFDTDGKIWITETGTGNDDGKISIINTDGTIDVFMENLPSSFNEMSEETQGVWRTYQQPNEKVIIVMGGGAQAHSGSLLSVDKSNFEPGNPLTLEDVETTFNIEDFVFDQGFIESNPYTIDWDMEGNMYIADAAANALLKRNKDTDELSVFAEFPTQENPLPFGPPFIESVPTKVLAKPDGGFYVCTLTGFPFVNGYAKIYEVDEQGEISVFREGLTLLTDMEIDPSDGTLCVLQFGEFGEVDGMFTFLINSAKVIKLMPDGTEQILVENFGPSPDFAFSPQGAIYATHLFFGQVLKFDFATSTKAPTSLQPDLTKVFPNPFQNDTQISFHLKQQSNVFVEILNPQGQTVAVLLNNTILSSGGHQLNWKGCNQNGQRVPTGLYAYKINVEEEQYVGWIYMAKGSNHK